MIDDDRTVRFVLAQALRDAGYAVQAFDGAATALQALEDEPHPELVFTDVRMPGMDGLGLLDALKARHPQLPVVVMSAYTDVASTAGAFRGGAHEFLSKPFDLDDAVALAQRALPERAPRQCEAGDPAHHGQRPTWRAELVGEAPAMRALFRAIGRLAQAPLSVLITGETGTGKELVARALHRESPRAARPFVALNTAAIPSELLESELFGHEAGAFTGASKRHIGRFEQADGGTLFLDEIGDMPLAPADAPAAGAGRRRVLPGRRPRADPRRRAGDRRHPPTVGGAGRTRPLSRRPAASAGCGAPAVAAPARTPRGHPAAGGALPRQRGRAPASPGEALGKAALERLRAHDWPGNVRELENLCWRLAALAPGDTISLADLVDALPLSLQAEPDATTWQRELDAWARARLAAGAQDLHADAKQDFEQVLLQAALAHCEGHRGDAALRLGLGRNTLTRKLGTSRKRR